MLVHTTNFCVSIELQLTSLVLQRRRSRHESLKRPTMAGKGKFERPVARVEKFEQHQGQSVVVSGRCSVWQQVTRG